MVLAAFDFGDEAAVDLQAVDARIAQIAEGGKALSKVIEARPRAQLTQAIDPEAQGWEIFRGAVFGDLEHQLRSLLGGRRQLLAKPVDELRIKDRSGEKIDRNQAAERVTAFLARHDFAHDMTIEFLDQAQTLGHRQENPGGNDHAAIVDHAQQNLLMVNRCRRSHAPHLLTEEQDTIFGEDAPQGFRPLAGRPRGHGPRSRALDLPGIGALGLGGAQGGVDLRKEIAEGLPRVSDEASVRDVQGIDQPRIVQLRQRLHEPGDEFIGFRLRNVGQNDREIRAGDVRRKMVDAAQGTTMPLDQRAESFKQGIDPGEPELFVEAPQILQFEQDERAAQEAILGTDQEAQLHVEVAAVGQAAHRVAEILGPDPFHRLRLLLEHLLDLGRHPVHRLDHAAQLKRPRQMLLDRILAIANRLGLRLDRARVQTGKISRFGLMELSRQRLRPALAETSYIPCPRCTGTGHIRSTESAALHILRILEEEAMKENTGAVHVQVPVDVATFLLNEKRPDIQAIELRHKVSVLLIPNIHLETPQHSIVRLRHDELNQDDLQQPSYKMVDVPSEENNKQAAAAHETRAPRQEAAIKGITPSQPAPIVPEKTKEPEEKAEKGFFAKILSWFRKEPEPVAAPKPERKPRSNSQRDGRRGGRSNNRRDEEREGREPRPNREPKEARPTQGQGPAREENQKPREPKEAREPRRQREPRPEKKESQSPVVAEVKEVLPETNGAEDKAPSAEGGNGGARRRGRRGGRRERGERTENQVGTQSTEVAESTEVIVAASAIGADAVATENPVAESQTPIESAVEPAIAPIFDHAAKQETLPASEAEVAIETPVVSAVHAAHESPVAPLATEVPVETATTLAEEQATAVAATDETVVANVEETVSTEETTAPIEVAATTPTEIAQPVPASVDLETVLQSSGLVMVETSGDKIKAWQPEEETSVPVAPRPRRRRPQLVTTSDEPLVMVETSNK